MADSEPPYASIHDALGSLEDYLSARSRLAGIPIHTWLAS